MKWWKKLLPGVLFLACIIAAATWIIFQGDPERTSIPKETLEPALEDKETPSEETADEGPNISDKAMEQAAGCRLNAHIPMISRRHRESIECRGIKQSC